MCGAVDGLLDLPSPGMEFRVAQYHLAIEADSPELALLAARQAEPDIVWTAPRSANAPARIDDPVIEHARWLLEEWAVRGADSINADLVEETKIAAQLLVRQLGRPS
jgi:hypothetical protein